MEQVVLTWLSSLNGPIQRLHNGPIQRLNNGPVQRPHNGPVQRLNNGPVQRVRPAAPAPEHLLAAVGLHHSHLVSTATTRHCTPHPLQHAYTTAVTTGNKYWHRVNRTSFNTYHWH